MEPTASGSKLDSDLGMRRAEAFGRRLAEAGREAGGQAEMIEQLAVMSLRFTDATALAGSTRKSGDESAVQYLLREMEAKAAGHGIAYLRFLSDRVVAAADPMDPAEVAMQRLAAFALDIQHICRRLFAEQHSGMAFCIGLDLGPVIGSLIGHDKRAFNFWGGASSTAREMADTALPGTIQCSESVYRALGEGWVFQLRGHHYLEGVGEFSTYLLSGRP